MDSAIKSDRLYPAYSVLELERFRQAATGEKAEIFNLAIRQRNPLDAAYVPTMHERLRAAKPNLARKPQDFDTSPLPLFGDPHKQKEMF